MIFFVCLFIGGLAVSTQGLLMLVWPAKFAQVLNWYFAKIRSSRCASAAKYSHWGFRVQGLLLVLVSLIIHYAVWLEICSRF